MTFPLQTYRESPWLRLPPPELAGQVARLRGLTCSLQRRLGRKRPRRGQFAEAELLVGTLHVQILRSFWGVPKMDILGDPPQIGILCSLRLETAKNSACRKPNLPGGGFSPLFFSSPFSSFVGLTGSQEETTAILGARGYEIRSGTSDYVHQRAPHIKQSPLFDAFWLPFLPSTPPPPPSLLLLGGMGGDLTRSTPRRFVAESRDTARPRENGTR